MVRSHPKLETNTGGKIKLVERGSNKSYIPFNSTGGLRQSDNYPEIFRSQRVLNENVIGKLKRFKILSDRYRNRRKRFGLRFNLIAGLYNHELKA